MFERYKPVPPHNSPTSISGWCVYDTPNDKYSGGFKDQEACIAACQALNAADMLLEIDTTDPKITSSIAKVRSETYIGSRLRWRGIPILTHHDFKELARELDPVVIARINIRLKHLWWRLDDIASKERCKRLLKATTLTSHLVAK